MSEAQENQDVSIVDVLKLHQRCIAKLSATDSLLLEGIDNLLAVVKRLQGQVAGKEMKDVPESI